MAKKRNLKAEKAKRNLEYARKHKKRKPMFGRGGRRPMGGGAPRPAAAPAVAGSAPAVAGGEGGDTASAE